VNGRNHTLLAALSGAAAALTLFQVWYVSLPLEQASAIDFCRLSPVVDCLKSLHAHGHEIHLWVVAVLPLLCACCLFMLALCAFAWVGDERQRDSWLALARLVSFPASGLALFVLLNDMMVANATSVSAILVAITCLTISARTVLGGLLGAKPRFSWPLAGILGAAVLGAFFMQGAVAARRGIDYVNSERDSAEPGVLWPRVARQLPRRGAAHLGNWTAPHEVILFVDGSDASKSVMQQAAALMPGYADKVLLTIVARGAIGAGLIEAQQKGKVAEFLRAPYDVEAMTPLQQRQQRGWPSDVKPADLPVALAPGIRRQGDFPLKALLDVIAR
jgi:hypothetical protein